MNFLRVSEGVGPRQPCLGRADATAERSRATRNNPVQAQTRYRQASDNASEAGQALHSCSCHRAALARLSAVSLLLATGAQRRGKSQVAAGDRPRRRVERGLGVPDLPRPRSNIIGSVTVPVSRRPDGRLSRGGAATRKSVLRFRRRATDDGTAPTADQEQETDPRSGRRL